MRPLTAALLATLLLATSAGAGTKPTRAALRKAFEANQASVVQVVGPRKTGPGVVVGAEGQVLTSVEYSGLETAQVKLGEQALAAKVLVADAGLGVVLLQVDGLGELRSVAVKLNAAFRRGDWLVGIWRKPDGSLAPSAGQVFSGPSERSRFIETDLALPAGSPLFDPQGRLVAIITRRLGALSSRALPVALVKLQLSAAAAPGGTP